MALIIAPMNVVLTITKMLLDGKLKKHLESLGISNNRAISVVSSKNGDLICKVSEGRVAINRELAEKIMVVKERVY